MFSQYCSSPSNFMDNIDHEIQILEDAKKEKEPSVVIYPIDEEENY